MGLWSVVALIIGNLIGAGVFLLPVNLAPYGWASLIGWFVAALGAICLSLVFAGLSARIPQMGGPHVYVREALGVRPAFIVAWSYWIISALANAAYPVTAISYLNALIGPLSLEAILGLEILILLLITGINLLGLQTVGRFELFLTALKTIPLILIPLCAIPFIDFKQVLAFPIQTGVNAFSAVQICAFMILWAFVGLESGTVPGQVVHNPSKTIPRATLIGTVVVALIYMLGTTAIMGVVPSKTLLQSHGPYADLASIIFGGDWKVFVVILSIIASLGALFGWTLVVARIAMGAAKDGLFPPLFKKVIHNGTPLWGVIISSLCSLLFMGLSWSDRLVGQFQNILEYSVTLILWIYGSCVVSYVVILKRKKELSFQSIIISVLSLIFVLWALESVPLKQLLFSILIMVLGLPLYKKWAVAKE